MCTSIGHRSTSARNNFFLAFEQSLEGTLARDFKQKPFAVLQKHGQSEWVDAFREFVELVFPYIYLPIFTRSLNCGKQAQYIARMYG